MDTLQVAKNDLRQGWETPKGAVCSCCGQKVKMYRRQIYKAVAKKLITLYRLHQNLPQATHFHMNEIGTPISGGGDFSKLRYWGLIEARPETEDSTKKSDGFWRITDEGRVFVEGKGTVTKYCHVYNGVVRFRSGNQISIHDALAKESFNYPELMGYLI